MMERNRREFLGLDGEVDLIMSIPNRVCIKLWFRTAWHQNAHFPTSSKVTERASKWVSEAERASEVSKAEQANEWASGPVLTFRFLAILTRRSAVYPKYLCLLHSYQVLLSCHLRSSLTAFISLLNAPVLKFISMVVYRNRQCRIDRRTDTKASI